MVLPAGIFVEVESTCSEFDDWTDKELISEILRLREMLRVHEECKKRREDTGAHMNDGQLSAHFC